MRLNSAVTREGSASHGVDHWWAQRVTAIALLPLAVWFLVSLLFVPRFDYASLARWMNQSWNAVLLVAFILVVARHSYLGVRVVVEDYVHLPAARIMTLLVVQFAHVLIAAAGIFAVLQVALGIPPFGERAQ